jgi:hypothetical protein
MISVLFPYRGDDGPRDRIFGWVLRWWNANFPEAEICVGRNFDDPFNRGKARNDAFGQSHGQVVVVADADTVPTGEGVRAAIADVIEARCWSIPYAENRYYNLTEQATADVLSWTTRNAIPEPDEHLWDHKITSWAGCLVIPREAWERVGGYDERFVGWGYEDNAFRVKLDRLWGPHRREDSYCCHLWHPVAEGSTFDQPEIERNRTIFLRYLQGDFK